MDPTMMTTVDPAAAAIGVSSGVAVVLGILLMSNIIMGIFCCKLAHRKGYKGYFFTGFFFGMVGLVYVVGLPDLNARKDMHLALRRMTNLHERMQNLENE